MKFTGQSPKNKRYFYFFFVFLSFLTYLPAFVYEYGLHNDYSKWCGEGFFAFTETIYLIVIGRPVQALLANAYLYLIKSISWFPAARFLNFSFSIFFSFLIVRYLINRLSVSVPFAIGLAFSILVLPASQVYVLLANNFVAGGFNIAVSFSAYMVMEMAHSGDNPRRRYLYYLPAQFIFLISLMIYPLTAVSFLIFTFARIIFSDFSSWSSTRKSVARDIVFTIFGIAFYFVLHRFILLPILAEHYPAIRNQIESVMGHPIYSMSFTTDIYDKVYLFYKLSMIAFAGVWHLPFGDKAGLVVAGGGAVSTAGFLFKKIVTEQKDRKKEALWFLQIAWAVIILVLIPNLPLMAAKGSIAMYRVSFVYSAMCAIAVFRMLEWIYTHSKTFFKGIIMTGVVFSIIVLSGAVAFKNILDTSLNAKRELDFIRMKMSGYKDFSKLKEIVIVSVPFGATYIDSGLKHEFKWNAVNWSEIPYGLARAVLREIGIYKKDIEVSVVSLGKPVYFDDKTFVIDMNDARLVGGKYSGDKSNVLVKSSDEGSTPSYAFFDKAFRSWSVRGYPQWLELTYPTKTKITDYKISCRTPFSIPLSWRLMGSDDGASWATLDKQDDRDINTEETKIVGGVRVPKTWGLLVSKNMGISWHGDYRGDYDASGQIYMKSEEIFLLERRVYLLKPANFKTYRFVFTAGNGRSLEINEINMNAP